MKITNDVISSASKLTAQIALIQKNLREGKASPSDVDGYLDMSAEFDAAVMAALEGLTLGEQMVKDMAS